MSEIIVTTAPMWGENIRILDVVVGEGYDCALLKFTDTGKEALKKGKIAKQGPNKGSRIDLDEFDILSGLSTYIHIIHSDVDFAVGLAKKR